MDMRTLLLERTCLLAFCTLLVLVNLRGHRGTRGLLWFAASNVGYLVGGVLIASRAYLPVWVAVVLANLLYSLGYAMLHRSLTAFTGARRWTWWAQCIAVALSLTLCTTFTLIVPDIRLRLAGIGLATGLQFVIAAMAVLHGRHSRLRSPVLSLASVLLFSAALNLLRPLLTLLWGTTQPYLQADDIQTTTVMLNTTIFVAIDLAYLWLIATSLRSDMQVQAMTDPLTGVMNRRSLETALESAVQRCRQTGQPLSMIMMDLDNFKTINDTLGHRAGDRALVSVTQCLRVTLRDSDTVARVGGDEFVILLPNCPRNGAHEIAERLRAAIEMKTLTMGHQSVAMKASFGVATLEQSHISAEMLLMECDRALYTAKRVGGNFVYVMS
ncbi:GGDEF domain-containing protein [Terriglobus tenax]|uniref:GGDEF domain-containing protein n=1 Tax=Terriglobus tenax TaxID=1111115 RepID=UPI0021E046BE|nr:GGDEF domain-containing protein [Terriglobus tenax]